MVKNIYKRTLSVLMSVLIMIPAFTSVSFADESLSDNSTPLVNISENAQSDNKISLNGSIEWDDNNNSEKNRPDSVTVNLYENDVLIDSKTTTESDQWQFTFNVNTQKDATTTDSNSRFQKDIQKHPTKIPCLTQVQLLVRVGKNTHLVMNW